MRARIPALRPLTVYVTLDRLSMTHVVLSFLQTRGLSNGTPSCSCYEDGVSPRSSAWYSER